MHSSICPCAFCLVNSLACWVSPFVPSFIIKHMQQADGATDQAERSRHSMAPSQVSAPTPARPSEPPVTSPHRQLPGAAYPPQDTAAPAGTAEAKENEANNFPRYAQKEEHDQTTSHVLVSSDHAQCAMLHNQMWSCATPDVNRLDASVL